MSPISTVFFDVGATLLTPAVNEGILFSQILKQHGFDVEPDTVVREIPTMYNLYEQLYEQDDSFWSDDVRARAIWIEMYEYLSSLLSVPPELRREVADAVYRFYFSADAWKTFEDVIPTLDLLKQKGIRMGLISNWDSSLASIIEEMGLGHYFETIVSSAVVRLHKPMPEIFNLALDRLGVKAEESLHIGDHPFADARGSASVGITPVLLDRHNAHQEFEGFRVQELTEIEALLLRV